MLLKAHIDTFDSTLENVFRAGMSHNCVPCLHPKIDH